MRNKNVYFSFIMSGPGVGFEYPPVEVSWLKRDVLLFANTVGATADELHFLYVGCPWCFCDMFKGPD